LEPSRRLIDACPLWLCRILGRVKSNLRSLLIALALVFLVGLCVFCFRDLDRARLSTLLAGLGWTAVVVLIPQTLGLALETWGWQLSIERAGHRLRFLPLWGIRAATEAVGQTLPGGAILGESLKPSLLARHTGLPVGAGVATTLHRKYLRMVAHGLYLLGAAVAGSSVLGVPRPLVGLLVGFGLALLVGAGAMQMFFRKGRSAVQLFVWVRRWRAAPWARWVSRYRTQFLRVDDATRGFFRLNLRDNAAPIFLCLLAWLGEAVESWLILRLLGAPVSFVAILAFDVALSLGRQLLFVLPAGLGLQDAGYVAALALLGVPDVATVGAAFVLLKRGRELLATLVGLGWGAGALSGARSLSGADWRPFPNVD